ncbi:LOW QUALITY PROTEIN: uncharacterized protein LOC119552546 [Drosophila subpulchrella]|uniref:LOW QUALITY PROTEIN: uncharacterized protein LOC119552546 n=1 Tax=Drosophila subpulchrella TaxID=1486046 RepID=UPI0018A177D3|nr:LOW QUALITY PROTEIN: uncharacterized protein LOC119552546 [Drosophila subpulchrella]
MRNHHRRPAKPGFRTQDSGSRSSDCHVPKPRLANAMQVPPTGPSGNRKPRAGLLHCIPSKAGRDKYLLTATNSGHQLRALIRALES